MSNTPPDEQPDPRQETLSIAGEKALEMYNFLETQNQGATTDQVLSAFHEAMQSGGLKEFGIPPGTDLSKPVCPGAKMSANAIINIMYARLTFDKEKQGIINIKYLAAEGMTPEKIRAIGKSLSVEQIQAMDGANLAAAGMTPEKIRAIIGGHDSIQAIGGANYAAESMTLEKMQAINESIGLRVMRIIGGANLAAAGMTPEKIGAIGYSLSVAQIQAIGAANLAATGMTPEKIRAIGRSLSVAQILTISGEKLAEEGVTENMIQAGYPTGDDLMGGIE